MRHIITISTVLLLSMSMRAQVKSSGTAEPELYTIKQSALAHSRPVSFSVGYPKGWRVSEAGPPQVGESLIMDDEPVCSFSPRPSRSSDNLLAPVERSEIIIWRTGGATAKAEAEKFAAALRQRSNTQRDLSPIKTEAGDSGYVVVSEPNLEKGHWISSDLFFQAGAKGAIRISITTRAEDSDMRENWQRLVLKTLRFYVTAPESVPAEHISPEDIVQDSIQLVRTGTNSFLVRWTYTETGAERMLALREAHRGKKVRTVVGDFQRLCTISEFPPNYAQWKESWLKRRTDKFFGVTEDDAKLIMSGLKSK